MKIATYNIQYNAPDETREQLLTNLHHIDADVVLLQELRSEAVAQHIATKLGMRCHYAPGDTLLHVAILSRLPVISARVHDHADLRRSVPELVVGGAQMHIFTAHLLAVLSLPTELARLREARVLAGIVAGCGSGFWLVGGDFNTLAPGDAPRVREWPLWLKWAGLPLMLHPLRRAIRHLQAQGWIDCFRRLNPAPGYTLPSHGPNSRLDYFWASAHLFPHVTHCAIAADLPFPLASDHLPLVVELSA